jgi:hypothetical protein
MTANPYPPNISDVNMFFKDYMDPGYLHSQCAEANGMYSDEYKTLRQHIEKNWDEGAKRTVYMHFNGFPRCWSQFIADYFFSLRDIENHVWVPLSNFSAYAVWLARKKGPFLFQ